MPDLSSEYLTTRELAELLRIKERKVYDLAASEEIPCTRAFGKLLFRRSAIDAWLARHATDDQAEPATAMPAVLLGSHDPLLDWSLRESGCGIATFTDGSLDGLERMHRGEGIGAGLHIFDAARDDWNVAAAEARFAGKAAVLVEWAWRERGLIVPAGNPHGIRAIEDLKGRRIAPRQPRSGSQVLLQEHFARAGLETGDVRFTHAARTETDAALAVADNSADAAFGLLAVARQYRLDFIPVIRERFDLLIWRRDWFEPPFQTLLDFCSSEAFKSRAAAMSGYDVSGLGRVHYNAR